MNLIIEQGCKRKHAKENKEQFDYLGITLMITGGEGKEIKKRIASGSKAVRMLSKEQGRYQEPKRFKFTG